MQAIRKRRYHHKNKTINSKSWKEFFSSNKHRITVAVIDGIKTYSVERIER